MSMIDYGALVKINGRIVNKGEFFMDMQKAVGWVDYPRIRYEDCNHLDEDGCSDCGECPRRQIKHMSDPKLGEWDATMGDCRGNSICRDDQIDGNYFAYVGDEDFTVATYKNWAIITNKANTIDSCLYITTLDSEPDMSKIVRTFTVQVGDETVAIKAKRIAGSYRCMYMKFRYKGNKYELVYGYGIDSNQKVWDRVKARYLHAKEIRFVDNFWKED